MTRWGRPLAISLVVHGTVLGSGALLLGTRDEDRALPTAYPVSLVFDPSVSGPPGPPGASAPLGSPGAASALPAPRENVVSPAPAPRTAEDVTRAPASTPESTETGNEGGGSGSGGGGGGTGSEGDGTGGGGAPAPGYEPPRLLAGALPLDPDAVTALQVPPEIPVRLHVGADGRVKEIVPEIEHLAPPILDALHRSADAMRFAPARSGGDPVDSWFSMTFVYRR